ncbi:MAG: hypothetical protein K5787_14260 [Lentisphaeria bacterium]|nr:hypothetical protein [Lentisphaeria bacterium]
MKKMTIQLFVYFCILVLLQSNADNAEPFDCAMPIILKPVLNEIYIKNNTSNNKPLTKPYKCRSSSWDFVLSTHLNDDDIHDHEKVVEISYDSPSRHVFKLFIKDGLVVRLEHIEPSEKVKVYRQTILDKLEKLHFADEEYTHLSKKCALDIYRSECLCLQMPDGAYKARIELDVIENANEIHFMGNLSLPEVKIDYKFSFYDRDLYLAVMLYSGEDRLPKNRKRPYYILRKGEYRNKIEYFIASASFHDKQSDSGFDVTFHKNMGLKSYNSNLRDSYGDMIYWDENGKETKRMRAGEIKGILNKTKK